MSAHSTADLIVFCKNREKWSRNYHSDYDTSEAAKFAAIAAALEQGAKDKADRDKLLERGAWLETEVSKWVERASDAEARAERLEQALRSRGRIVDGESCWCLLYLQSEGHDSRCQQLRELVAPSPTGEGQ